MPEEKKFPAPDNRFLVTRVDGKILIRRSERLGRLLSHEDALNLCVWLAAQVNDDAAFEGLLEKVRTG